MSDALLKTTRLSAGYGEMPVLRDEVLPRLERLKIRKSRGH